jgi:hypothetical protein
MKRSQAPARREGLSREQVARIVGSHREQMARLKYLPPRLD